MTLMTFDQAVAALPGGRLQAERIAPPCPAHAGRNRNLSVWADEQGTRLFQVPATAAQRARSWPRSVPGQRRSIEPRSAAALRKPADEKANRDRGALRSGARRESHAALVVQDYLLGRGFHSLDAKGTVRRGRPPRNWHAPAWASRDPGVDPIGSAALVLTGCLPADDGGSDRGPGRPELPACFVRSLKPDGTGKADVEKPKRRRLDLARACSVHLTAGAPELVLCEGIETGLSILQATGRHVWVAVGTSNLGSSRAARLCARDYHRGRPRRTGDEGGKRRSRNVPCARIPKVRASPQTATADWNDELRR